MTSQIYNTKNSPVVTLTRCEDYSESKISASLQRHFELHGGIGNFLRKGDTVLIKPNFISPRRRENATQTDPAIIIELAKLLKDYGARPFVGDSPAWGNIEACAKILNLVDPLKKLGVPIKQLNQGEICRIGKRGMPIKISSIALDTDVIINLPKFKSHQQLVATFAVKNIFGVVSGKKKAYWHFAKGRNHHDFCKLLIDIYKFMNPALTIIDAVTAMDGPGPIRGRARPLGWIIGGTDPVACEMVCCKLVNINPSDIPVISTAMKTGFGCSDFDKIKILGDDFSNHICTDFQLPDLIPIRFSLFHVCKSTAKQFVLLAKSNLAKKNINC